MIVTALSSARVTFRLGGGGVKRRRWLSSPCPLRLCRNSIYVIPDKRSAIRNPVIMKLVLRASALA